MIEDVYPGAKRGLEEVAARGGDARPFDGLEVGAPVLGGVELGAAVDGQAVGVVEAYRRVALQLPKDGEAAAYVVVVEADQLDGGEVVGFVGVVWGDDLFNEVLALA